MRPFGVVVLCACIATCGGKKSPTEATPPVASFSSFVTQAVTVGAVQTTSVSRTGSPPAAAGGPVATVGTTSLASSGSPNLLTIASSVAFHTVYVSVGTATSVANDYLQIDLPAPATVTDVAVNYPDSLTAGSFELRIQIAAPGGAVGGVTTAPKTVTSRPVVTMVGVVLSTFGPNPANRQGPGLYGPPVPGAVISTSLDSKTTTTNANGAFELQTDTASSVGNCFTLTISATGFPTYSTGGWKGNSAKTAVTFTLAPPQPPMAGC